MMLLLLTGMRSTWAHTYVHSISPHPPRNS
jgi:hypothetical protein